MYFNLAVSPRSVAKRLTIGVLVFTVLSILVQIGKYIFNYRSDLMTVFNMDREMNFPTWYSAFMLAFCAFLLKTISSIKQAKQSNFYHQWQLLANIFWFLAIDEVLSIHELLIIPDLAKTLHLPGFLRQVWVIPGAIFVIWLGKYYWKFLNHLDRQIRLCVFSAATLYVGGALVMEMIGGAYSKFNGQQNIIYALMATLEEAMEMMGVIVFIYGLLSYLGRYLGEFQLQVKIRD